GDDRADRPAGDDRGHRPRVGGPLHLVLEGVSGPARDLVRPVHPPRHEPAPARAVPASPQTIRTMAVRARVTLNALSGSGAGAASATAMSEGWVATQCGDPPRIARLRWSPARAGQPEPGSRLLHGLVTSWKYRQRVRCSRLPPTVAMFRSWPDAPPSTARASTAYPARTRGSAAKSLARTPSPNPR